MARADRTRPLHLRTPFHFPVRAKKIPARPARLSKCWRRAQNWNRLQWRRLPRDRAREKTAPPDRRLPRDKQVRSWEFSLEPLARKNSQRGQRVFRRIKFLLQLRPISAPARRPREECFLRRAARPRFLDPPDHLILTFPSSPRTGRRIGRKSHRR